MEHIVNIGGEVELEKGRVHELSGPSALPFALLVRQGTTVVCGSPGWVSSLDPDGCAGFGSPGSMIHVPCPIKSDALWTAEMALRSGSVGSVILETYRTPDLTYFRRLQLAAETGQSLGLLLVTSPARSSAAETRWHCVPERPDRSDAFCLHVSRYKNKRGNLGSFKLNATQNKDAITVDAAPAGGPLWPERVASF